MSTPVTEVAKTLVLATLAKKVGVLFENGGPPLHGFRGIPTSFSQMLLKPRFWQHFLGQNAIFHIKPMENQQFSSQRPSWPLLTEEPSPGAFPRSLPKEPSRGALSRSLPKEPWPDDGVFEKNMDFFFLVFRHQCASYGRYGALVK